MGDKEKILFRELASFNIIGLINTAITYGLYAFFISIGIPYMVALILEYCFGIFFSFQANRRYTFKHTGHVTFPMIISMIGSYLGVLCLNFILLVFFVERMKWNPYLSQFLALGAAVFVSFLAQKYIVFRPRKF